LRIDIQLREKMFMVYQETLSLSQVTARCGLHKLTAKRYRILDDWDARIERINKRIHKKVDVLAVNRRLRNVQVLDMAIEDIKEQIKIAQEKGLIGIIDPKLLPRMVVAQDFLIGRGAADEEHVELSVEAREALTFLTSLGEKSIIQLADIISAKLAEQATNRNMEVNHALLPDVSSGQYMSGAGYKIIPKPRTKPPVQKVRIASTHA